VEGAIEFSGWTIDFALVVDAKIDEHWAQFDVIGVM